jgi:co-chaperonin GroES (HSP10)
MTATTLRPVGPHLLVRPDAPPKETASGLLLPQSHARPPNTAVVVKVGLPRQVTISRLDEGQVGVRRVSTEDFEVGCKICFRWIDSALREFDVDGEKLQFVRIDEIIGKVE